MNFKIGQKVVCVDDSKGANTGARHLVKGQVYLIEGIDPDTNTGLYLSGVPRQIVSPWKYPVGWNFWRFRPVIEKSTDTGMAILREILDRETVQDSPRLPLKAR